MKKLILSGAALLAFPLIACASYPAPTEHLANSYANIRAAQEVGALSSPQAALHLKLAQEEQAKAKALVDDGKNEPADFMTMRANSDAELAIALTRETSAQGKAGQAVADVTAAAQNSQPPPGPSSFSATTTTTSTTLPSNGSTK
jgi:maltose-binding protein MalE